MRQPDGLWSAFADTGAPNLWATALALNALLCLPTQTRCRSSYSLAWLALALDVYTEVRAEVPAALNAAQEHLAARIDDPGDVDDTSTIALAALALGLEAGNNPFALGG